MSNTSMGVVKIVGLGLAAMLLLAAAIAGVAVSQLAVYGAGALLHPLRRAALIATPSGCQEREFSGVDVVLSGWVCRATARRRGTVIWLHGVADNRASGVAVIDRFVPRGFDVVAYDSRGHGKSSGDYCTYGFFEKRDLSRVIDALEIRDVIVIGGSLGAAVALQGAAVDDRIHAVVAASTFSDLRTVATERAPSFFYPSAINAAFEQAEHQARFVVDDVSPLRAAAQIHVPVLMIHGDLDRETPPSHSERVFAALAGEKRFLHVVAGHNDALSTEVWETIEDWIEGLERAQELKLKLPN